MGVKTLEVGIKIEYVGKQWVIWKSHDKDFRYGSYYLLKTDGTIDLIIERPGDVSIAENIK